MRQLMIFCCIVLLSSCAGNDSRTANRLDSRTGVTVTFSQPPVIFYSDASGKAAHAKSLIHLGPIEVNRMGEFRYYLWLGIWDTMQDSAIGNTRNGFESIVVFADGEPLSLDLVGWTPASIGASEAVYLKPVSGAADAYYEITIDHLRVIAEAKELRIHSTGPRQQSFELWNEQQAARNGLREFLKKSIY
jgi:hypothetical protein